jgi:hypothetical protein
LNPDGRLVRLNKYRPLFPTPLNSDCFRVVTLPGRIVGALGYRRTGHRNSGGNWFQTLARKQKIHKDATPYLALTGKPVLAGAICIS